jgi:hypothetical protein
VFFVFIEAGSHVAEAEPDALAELDEPASSTGAPHAPRATTAVPTTAAPNRRTGRETDMLVPSFSGPRTGWGGPFRRSM